MQNKGLARTPPSHVDSAVLVQVRELVDRLGRQGTSREEMLRELEAKLGLPSGAGERLAAASGRDGDGCEIDWSRLVQVALLLLLASTPVYSFGH